MATFKCSKCGSHDVAVEVRTWANFDEQGPCGFDDNDVAYVEPIPGGEVICRDCQHISKVPQ
jgi:hypothetical protein